MDHNIYVCVSYALTDRLGIIVPTCSGQSDDFDASPKSVCLCPFSVPCHAHRCVVDSVFNSTKKSKYHRAQYHIRRRGCTACGAIQLVCDLGMASAGPKINACNT
jgi:hypothetical protein